MSFIDPLDNDRSYQSDPLDVLIRLAAALASHARGTTRLSRARTRPRQPIVTTVGPRPSAASETATTLAGVCSPRGLMGRNQAVVWKSFSVAPGTHAAHGAT